MLKKILWILSGVGLAALSVPVAIVLPAWLKFNRLETTIVDKMDQYYLNITTPGREEYMLAEDEVFEGVGKYSRVGGIVHILNSPQPKAIHRAAHSPPSAI